MSYKLVIEIAPHVRSEYTIRKESTAQETYSALQDWLAKRGLRPDFDPTREPAAKARREAKRD